MNRNLFLSLVGGLVLGLTAASCTPPASDCSSTNCPTGCCDSKGECQAPTSSTCGFGGNACSQCGIGETCSVAGTCQGGFGGGSGMTTGGGVGTTGGGNGTTGGGNGTSGGGVGTSGGGVGTSGGGVGTSGGGVGTSGGGVGTSGGGTGTTGGGTGTATVGTPCTNTSQCAGLANGYCKLTTQAQSGFTPSPYPTGFCTTSCTGSCPGGSTCAGGPGSILNWRNETAQFCVPSCATQGASCANNLRCNYVTDLSSQTPSLGCWLDFNGLNALDAGWVPFSGGGYPVNVGNACTSDSQCQNPPDYLLGYCLESTNGFPGGYCLANSTYTDTSAWCTGAGKVENWSDNADGGNPEFYYCTQGCPTIGDSTGLRPGYSCWQRASGEPTPVGIVWPSDCATTADCSNYANALPQYQWSCDVPSGFCCTGDAGCIISLH